MTVLPWPESFDYIARCLVAQWRGMDPNWRELAEVAWDEGSTPSVADGLGYEAILWSVQFSGDLTLYLPLISLKEG